jgi:hypothetical protein
VLLTVAAARPAVAADRDPLALPLWLDPILLLQPLAGVRVEDRPGSGRTEPLFGIERAELGFALDGGSAQAELSVDVANAVPELRDAFVGVRFFEGAVAARAGFLRPPLAREYLADGHLHTLPVEPEALAVVAPQRELGAEVHGRIAGILACSAGVWSGAAEGADGEPRRGELRALTGGRLVVEPLGPVPAAAGASDLEGGGPRLAAGAAALFGRRRDVPFPAGANGEVYGEDRLRLGGEIALKWGGVGVTAEVVWSRRWAAPGTRADLRPRLPRVDGMGGYLQVAAFALPKRLELAARCDAWDEDVDIGGARVSPMAGASWYALGTHVVVRLAYRARFAVRDPFPGGSPYATPLAHEVLALIQLSI